MEIHNRLELEAEDCDGCGDGEGECGEEEGEVDGPAALELGQLALGRLLVGHLRRRASDDGREQGGARTE